MSITLKSIAESTGVSISTVSRIINGDKLKKASPKTEKKVWDAVHRLGYVPNQHARNLIKGNDDKRSQNNELGIILASKVESFSHPFFADLLACLSAEISKRNCKLVYSIAACNYSDADLYNALLDRPVSGAIILGRFSRDRLTLMQKSTRNLVYTGLNFIGRDIDEVICDSCKAIETAVEYLIELGHRKIGYIGNARVDEQFLNEHRYDSFVRVMQKHGIPIDKNYVKDVPFISIDSAAQAMDEILQVKRPPTAICCMDDYLAIGILRSAYVHKVSIPGDISIVSLPGLDFAKHLCPSLTTIDMPRDSMSRMAVSMLLDKIESKREMGIRVDVPFEFTPRESCAKLDKGA